MRIVFMGTPDYSVKTLEALKRENHEILAVFARPDKPVGRKQILTPPPTKVFALENNIPVFQPSTLRDGKALEIIKELNPEVIVVVAYGMLLPKEILDYPKYGCINGHASLLPKYRGASPIQWCIYKGETITGVTTMLMDEGMDTGDILLQAETEIGDITADELFEKLSYISAELMVKTLNEIDNLTPIKQNGNEATYAPIIKKDMALIDFNKTALEIHNTVRAFYSWPSAFFFKGDKRVKVLKTEVLSSKSEKAGTVIENKDKLVVACGNNTALALITVKPEGSKEMDTKTWLLGNKISLGSSITEA